MPGIYLPITAYTYVKVANDHGKDKSFLVFVMVLVKKEKNEVFK
jgi:hypothetical protein